MKSGGWKLKNLFLLKIDSIKYFVYVKLLNLIKNYCL